MSRSSCCRSCRHSTRPSARTSAAAVGVAQRPPDGRLRGAGRDRPPGAARPGQRPDDGARLRPRHHRAAAQHRHGLHRRRAGRAPRRAGRGRGAVPLLLVGAPPARRGVGLDALAAAGERGLARPQHRRGAHRPAPRRLRVPAGRGPARGEGAAPVRAVGLGGRPLRRPPPSPLRAPVAGHPAAGAVGGRLPGHRPRRQPRRVLGDRGRRGRRPDRPGRGRVFLQTAFFTSADRLRRAELGARRRRGPGRRRAAARGGHGPRPARCRTATRPADGLPRREIRFRDVRFALPGRAAEPVLDGFDLTIPAGTSLAIVGQNGAGKTTLAKLLCRLYDPTAGASRSTASTCASWTCGRGGRGSPRCSRTSSATSCRCGDNVAPERRAGRGRWRPRSRPPAAPALADLGTVLSRGYDGGTDLSGGQWQRVALARALCAVRPRRGRRAARRADGAARRAGRGRDLRAGPRRHPPLHDDPRLPPLLDRAAGGPHLRRRARPGRRARHPRRADAPRRALPDDVRPPGVPLRRGRRARGGGGP